MMELCHLAAGYHGQMVFEDVNAALLRGQLTMIIGRNGAGKSTLLKTMLGLLPCSSGHIVVDDQPLETMPLTKRAQRMAYVRQERNVPSMQVQQLVLHGRFPYLQWPRTYRPEDYRMAEKAMEQMGIHGYANRSLASLSGGERQKAYIAMALAQQADYLFFDEPASFMDLPSQQALTTIFHQLRDAGKGVIVVEHDLCHALEHADQLLVLHDHRLMFHGSPEAFLHTDLDLQVFHTRIFPVQVEGRTHYVCQS